MPDIYTLLQYHEIISVVVFLVIAALIVKVGAGFIDRWLSKKKAGTKEGCEDCIAMRIAIEDVPIIKVKQEILRTKELPLLNNILTAIQENTKSLDSRVSKLFTLIEDSWKNEIKNLREELQQKEGNS